MNRQIRYLGVALIALFLALLAQLTNWQLVQADKLANHPLNVRVPLREYNRARGEIESADGAVLARSRRVDNGDFRQIREYPEGPLFGHITGYLSFNYGDEGAERTYDEVLTGESLQTVTQIKDIFDEKRTNNVRLTISKRLQEVARDNLGDRKGAVIAINPRDGAVLALWSYPSYDPNLLAGHDRDSVTANWNNLEADENDPRLPRAWRRSYPPGSTFKIVTAAAALERSPALTDKDYPRLSSLDLPRTDKNLGNFGGGTCGGKLPDLLRVSCNTGFAQMGLDLGAEQLHGEAVDFGFNQRMSFDLPVPENAVSIFPDPTTFERDEPALAQSAIGQRDVQATPMQMALVTAAIANDGTLMKPHVMGEVRDSDGKLVRNFSPSVWKRSMSSEQADELTDLMIQVVERGTATRLKIPGVQVAGKTGTAQAGTFENGSPRAHVWIVAFAPADNPTIAVAVMVENQDGRSGEATGGRVAAPIAAAVIKAHLGLS